MSLRIRKNDRVEVITGKEYGGNFAYWMLALLLIIALGSLSSVVSEEKQFTALAAGGNVSAAQAAATRGEAEEVGFWATLFHPKVLGLALILLIAMFTIQKLASKPD